VTTDIDNDEIKRQVVAKLVEKNPGMSEADVASVVDEEFAALADRPVRDYLSILTERAAKKRLKKSQ
jgi:Xaa-Pro aminopeptidase